MAEKLLGTKYNEYDLTGIENPYYQNVRLMDDIELTEVAEEIREFLLKKWVEDKQPLGGGKKSDEQIVSDFRSLINLDTNSILKKDFHDFENVLKYFGKAPSGINQYFPEMLDTKISLGNKATSVMDVIKDKDVFKKFFQSIVFNDRMYAFTMWYGWGKGKWTEDCKISDIIPDETLELLGDVAMKYSDTINNTIINRYDGYKLPLFFEKDNVYYKLDMEGCSKNSTTKKVRYLTSEDNPLLFENQYKSNMKIFPQITQSFRLGGGSQPVSNFSAGITKFLILNGFENSMKNNLIENDTFVVLDTSTGWSGRLVGLLSCYTQIRKMYKDVKNHELRVVYLTTDPNEEIHDRYNVIINDWFNTIEPDVDKSKFKMFKSLYGSETPEFLNFCKDILIKLKVSGCNMGLTSPPYFNRERYNDNGNKETNQSWGKHGSNYKEWSTDFLRPTISNISELVVDGGIFFMNIADLKSGSGKLPLEQDTIDYGKEFGFKCSKENEDVFKMMMATMTGNNQNLDTGGKPNNSVEIEDGLDKNGNRKSKYQKYEPIFIMRKMKK